MKRRILDSKNFNLEPTTLQDNNLLISGKNTLISLI